MPAFTLPLKSTPYLLSTLVSILLLVGVGYTVMDRFGGKLYPAPAVKETTKGNIVAAMDQSNPPASSTPSDLPASLVELHLFGQILAKPTAPLPVEKAPETKLKLVLHGVMKSSEGEKSFAIISNARGEQDFYPEGTELPEGATILAVHDDYVVLHHNDRLETLRMPEDDFLLEEGEQRMSAAVERGDFLPQATTERTQEQPPPRARALGRRYRKGRQQH